MDKKNSELLFMPDDKLLSAVVSAAENMRSFSAAEHSAISLPPVKTEEQVRLEILISSAENAESVYEAMLKEEETKAVWRTRFIVFFSAMLVAACVYTGVLVEKIATGKAEIASELVLALFTYIFANIFSILFFMVKYVSNNRHLDTFNTVTKKLLDYLIQDKNSDREAKTQSDKKTSGTKKQPPEE